MLYRLNEAIDIYRRVLTIDPDHEAAVNNLEVVAALQARLTDDPGMDIEMEREEGEDAEPWKKMKPRRLLALPMARKMNKTKKILRKASVNKIVRKPMAIMVIAN